MTNQTRRDALILGLAASAAAALPGEAVAQTARAHKPTLPRRRGPRWPAGVEGQRKGDLGNGLFLNPVLAGDHSDPSVLKDGDVYYKVSSSFYYYPGLLIWQSRDLVNWTPVGPAIREPVGSVYAPDLIKYRGRYYIYFPALNIGRTSAPPAPGKARKPILGNYVVHADNIAGPWSAPVDLDIPDGIDPGHVVGEDGKRYLFISDGRLIPLRDDGLARAGASEKVYDGWKYPEDWVVETFALEGPKVIRRNGWFYMFTAEGGTAGPPTSHMIIVARSRTVRGPWENCPHNPIVRTQTADEPWWSRGHATALEGPAGDWWLVYHGYENGLRTLGRQLLLEPFEWDANGWPTAKGGDLSRPLRKPRSGSGGPHGLALSDPFDRNRLGTTLAFFNPNHDYAGRARIGGGAMTLTAQGDTPAKSSPLAMNAGDRSYEVSVEVELNNGAQGGLLLFYDDKYFCGIGGDAGRLRTYKLGAEPPFGATGVKPGTRFFLRVRNIEEVATFLYSTDGKTWKTITSIEVSGYNHNMADGFLNLRPAIYASDQGSVTFRNLRYAALGN